MSQPPERETFGERFTRLVDAAGLSSGDVMRIVGWKSQSSFYKAKRGDNGSMSAIGLLRLAKKLGVSPYYLMGEHEPNFIPISETFAFEFDLDDVTTKVRVDAPFGPTGAANSVGAWIVEAIENRLDSERPTEKQRLTLIYGGATLFDGSREPATPPESSSADESVPLWKFEELAELVERQSLAVAKLAELLQPILDERSASAPAEHPRSANGAKTGKRPRAKA